jgi:hypothetical protein
MKIETLEIEEITKITENDIIVELSLPYDDSGNNMVTMMFRFNENNTIECEYIQIMSQIGYIDINTDTHIKFDISDIESMIYSKKELLKKLIKGDTETILNCINEAYDKFNKLKRFKASNTEFEVKHIVEDTDNELLAFARDKTYKVYMDGDYKGNKIVIIMYCYIPFFENGKYAIMIDKGQVQLGYQYVKFERPIKSRDIKGTGEFSEPEAVILDCLSKNNIFEDVVKQLEHDIDTLNSTVEVH